MVAGVARVSGAAGRPAELRRFAGAAYPLVAPLLSLRARRQHPHLLLLGNLAAILVARTGLKPAAPDPGKGSRTASNDCAFPGHERWSEAAGAGRIGAAHLTLPICAYRTPIRAPKPGQTHEPEGLVEVREWIAAALGGDEALKKRSTDACRISARIVHPGRGK